jgi:antitoxin (DNA-binding transcriptional repressor) of toxin-antitoxin stability system
MTHMKSASVREVQHNLSAVLDWVARGEEVQVTKRRRVVARLLPPEPLIVATPDYCGRARKLWGPRPKGKSLSETVSDARGER